MFDYNMVLYAAYVDNNLVYRGTSQYVGLRLGFSEGTIRRYAENGKLLRKRYKIIREGPLKEIDDKEERYNSIKRMLLLHGNTICSCQPYSIIRKLEKEGIFCIATKKKDYEDGSQFYLLERLK